MNNPGYDQDNKIVAENFSRSINDPVYDHACALFEKANSTNLWDSNAFAGWLAGANTQSWNYLEEAWQRSGTPATFSWEILKTALKRYGQTRHATPLSTLTEFLFPPGIAYQEGHWMDWQTDAVKAEIFTTAQEWMRTDRIKTVNWNCQDKPLSLLRIAVLTKNLPLWRQVPKECIDNLEWKISMYWLNVSGIENLFISDIERIPEDKSKSSLVDIMLQAVQFEWRTIARCIELEAGPGLWLQYVFSGSKASFEGRRRTAWNNMKLDGIDAWAMSQYVLTAPSFEASFDGMNGYKSVREHETWARRWWTQCMLGMDYEQAYSMACHVRTPLVLDETYPVDELLLSDQSALLS